jgi:hypothetical protein
VFQGVFLLVPSLYLISRLFTQTYLTYLEVNLMSNVLIIVYHLLRGLFGEFQVLTCETLGGFTIYLSSGLINVYIYLQLVYNTILHRM